MSSGWGVGLLFFGGQILVHAILWRYCVPARRYPILFAIFLLLPLFSGFHSTRAFWVALCLSLNYLAIFPAVEASSPTLAILNHLLRSQTVTEPALRAYFEENVVSGRLEDLKAGKFVQEDGGRLVLSLRGRCLASLFRNYRSFLGLPLGDGG